MGSPRPEVVRGIGDDCAILDMGGDRLLLVTKDLLVEEVHFLPTIDPAQLGWKALAVNLSDIAAMGGEPVAFFLGLGLAPETGVSFVTALRDGLGACARAFGVDLLGGDTVRSPVGLAISITVLGRVPRGEALLRSGARPGDRILLGGRTGDSAAGLHLLLHPEIGVAEEIRRPLLRAHLEPQPQISLGRLLASRCLATAMIDVSDGLLQDLGHILEESGVGAEIDADALPLSDEARALGAILEVDPRDWALRGGEDYVLLFTAPLEREVEVLEACREDLGLKVFSIGFIQEGGGLQVRRDGRWEVAGKGGFDHFGEDPVP